MIKANSSWYWKPPREPFLKWAHKLICISVQICHSGGGGSSSCGHDRLFTAPTLVGLPRLYPSLIGHTSWDRTASLHDVMSAVPWGDKVVGGYHLHRRGRKISVTLLDTVFETSRAANFGCYQATCCWFGPPRQRRRGHLNLFLNCSSISSANRSYCFNDMQIVVISCRFATLP